MQETPTVKSTLTSRQEEIYEFLKDKILNRGYGPTVREIGNHFGIKSPNGVMCHLKALEKKGLITREGRMSRAIQLVDSPKNRTSLPMAGQIAAGSPLLAEEQSDRVEFGPLLEPDDQFCLEVHGESMIEAHIAPGDFVVLRRQETANEGDIVAALIDGQDATLKYFHKDADRFRLEPANSSMEPIYATDVKILGVAVGVIRKF